MAQQRTVTCPECQAPKITKANRGVRLVCTQCGASFRCPDPAPAGGPLAPAADEAPAPITPGPAPTSNGVTVSRARPVIGQTARPRERGATKAPPAPPAPPADPPTPPPPSGKTGDVKELQAAGRRGGLASYAAWRRGR